MCVLCLLLVGAVSDTSTCLCLKVDSYVQTPEGKFWAFSVNLALPNFGTVKTLHPSNTAEDRWMFLIVPLPQVNHSLSWALKDCRLSLGLPVVFIRAWGKIMGKLSAECKENKTRAPEPCHRTEPTKHTIPFSSLECIAVSKMPWFLHEESGWEHCSLPQFFNTCANFSISC